MRAQRRGSVLYVSYDGLLEPLGASQILPYVRLLRRMGISMELLSFEKPDAFEAGRRNALQQALAHEGIPWKALRYHRRPTLPATAWDVWTGRRFVRRWARALRRERRAGLIHARGYVPGLIGLAGTSHGAKLLFDMRGFWVDERIQGGYWTPRSLQVRIGRWMERRVLGGAHHLILLTRRGTRRLVELSMGMPTPPWEVVPTCVDLGRFTPAADKASLRVELGIGRGPVLLHTGTVVGWYDGRFTMDVGRVFVRRTGGTFVVLTREVDEAQRLAREAGVAALVRFVSPDEMPRWVQAADAGLALPRIAPSKDASFPTKIAEYLACGLAVLATPIGDVAELEDGVSLRLVTCPEDVTPAVEWLAAAVVDPRLPAAARAQAEARLGVDRGAATLLDVYHRLGVDPSNPPVEGQEA
ncbi:MAG TPA: glycosyltransferase [Longimicrobiales bacterium]|nr:glycosyltransferase [Longimicrobiales bacterium]